MSLKEKAVDAYKRKAEQERKENLKDAEFSAVAAEKILKERIGEGFNIQIISKEPNATVFDVDGIKFVVGIGDSVCIIRKCEKCETEYSEYVPPNFGDREKFFRDIGKIIAEPHNDYDCQRIREMRKERANYRRKIAGCIEMFHTREYRRVRRIGNILNNTINN